jgi:hypothetical protein
LLAIQIEIADEPWRVTERRKSLSIGRLDLRVQDVRHITDGPKRGESVGRIAIPGGSGDRSREDLGGGKQNIAAGFGILQQLLPDENGGRYDHTGAHRRQHQPHQSAAQRQSAFCTALRMMTHW